MKIFNVIITSFSLSLCSFAAYGGRNCQEALSNLSFRSYAISKIPSNGYFSHWDELIIKDEVVSFSVHTSKSFDHNKTTYEAVTSLNRYIRSELEIKNISIVEEFRSGKPVSNHYIPIDEIDVPIRSKQGNHKMQFTNLKRAIFYGGYFEICLNNALRDMFLGLKPSGKEIDLYFVKDATYVSDTFSGVKASNEMKKKYDVHKNNKLAQFPLSEVIPLLSKSKLVNYLKKHTIDSKNEKIYIGGRSMANKNISEDVKINYYNEDKLLGSVGDGKLTINIRLTLSTLVL